jgi:cell division protein YceG involved in septum cleavage
VNSKQVVAAVSAVILVVILVYPSVSVGAVSVSLQSAGINKADHVYITIDSVWAHQKGQATGEGWKVVFNQSVSVDLVSLESSAKLIGTGQIPSGDYDSIRIQVSNVTWVFNKTTAPLGIASPEVDGTLDFTVGTGKGTNILITLFSQQQMIANSQYYTAIMSATKTS